VPGSWAGGWSAAHGAGTYRLRIVCRSDAPLALALPFQQTAAAVFVNGRQVGHQGQPGLDAATHQPAIHAGVALLDAAACPLEVRAQVSNFELYRGGIMRSMQLGTRESLLKRRELALLRTELALGAVLMVGVFALMFHLGRRRGRLALDFALLCFSFALILGLSGERALQPFMAGVPFGVQMRVLFGNWYFAVGMYALLVGGLYPRQVQRRVLRFFVAFSWAGVAISIALPLQWVAYTSPALQVAGLAIGVWVAWVLARAWRARERGAAIVAVGLGALVATGLHDVLFYQHLLSGSALPYGVAAFVLAPGVLLAQRLARALAAEERQAAEHRGRADLLVEATRAGVLDWDGRTGGVACSDRLLEMLGLPAEAAALRGRPFWELVHPADRERIQAGFLAQLREGGAPGLRRWPPMQARMLRADGQVLWVHGEALSVRGPQGRTLRYIATFIDITELKAAEEALATERERLRLLVRSTKAGFGDWDAARDVVTYTARFKEMLGYPADHDTSQWPSIFEMMHPEDRERSREQFRAMIRRKPHGGLQEPGEPMSYRLRRRDGSYIWIHAEGIAQVDDEGRTLRFITSYLDVTRFREQEEALRAQRELLARQNEALKENVRLREEVERVGRHDLKTPLNSIVAVPRLLREERKLGAEADELLGIVERAGYRILSMVNLSLDLYKMEQGSYVFRPDAVDLADLAHKVIADVRMHAASKQVRLQLQAWQAPYAWAEELLCYSLLANLLKNAVEASPEGGTVTTVIEAGEGGTVRVRIHNLGAVPEAIRLRFFAKYTTLGKASGTGLGTYSAWLMAKVQDGAVAMQTSDEDGTTLTVTLRSAPAGKVPAALRHAAERRVDEPAALAALPPTRVLLVDDDEYNLLIVRRFLPSPPFTVDTAINGRVALANAELQWPDLVFMDLDMPVMGGLEAVGKLRELQRRLLAGPCTIVALSSHDDEETRHRAIAAGFDRYLTKPVTRELVHAVVLEQHATIGTALPTAPAPLPAPRVAHGSPQLVHVEPDIEPILGEFIASRRELLAQLDEVADEGDRGEVRRIAHLLAGSFALYGFGWASERSRWLEKNFSDVPQAQVRSFSAELREHLDSVQIRFGDAGPLQ
jgi:PAS domain S-box-containing protein